LHYSRIHVIRYLGTSRTFEETPDYVARETPVEILVNGEPFVTILASPTQQKELAVGHLLAEGVLRGKHEIRNVTKSQNRISFEVEEAAAARSKLAKATRLVTTHCGSLDAYLKLIDRTSKPHVESEIRVGADLILTLATDLTKRSRVFRRTGGTHAAALFHPTGELLSFSEDVGRHNAIDKVIGDAAIKGALTGDHLLFSTGRMSADMVMKPARCNIPIVASTAGALNSGVVAARRAGVTLVGFVRGQRMNIYSNPWRILS
jgi:FdhD protein